MQETAGFTLPSTTHLVEVDVAPEWADIHLQFAPLLRIAGICPVANAVSVAVSSGVSAGNLSGSDEEEPARGRRSPAMSPVRAAESKLAELVAPVSVTLPPPMSSEDAAFITHYVQNFRAREEMEKDYVAFIFAEYKKRKGVEQKWWTEVEAMQRQLEALRQRELPPEVREAVSALVEGETAARAAVWAAYDKFLEWIAATTPQWVEAAQRQEQTRLANEKAKKAAMAAAREALAQELAMGKQLSGAGVVAARSSPGSPSPAAAMVNDDGTLSYEPAVSLDQQMAESEDPAAHLNASQLRLKAIRMLEAEEEEMKRRREEQVRLLRVQEEQLRAEIALKTQHEQEQAERKARESAQQHEDELAKRYNALLEQEFALQNRVREKEEAQARKEAERRTLMEHVAAEEQLLRQRIQEKEERRKASEEETARVAREQKMREIREQEEALRRRIAERDAAAEAERAAQAAKARREAEEAAVRAAQAEALRASKEEREKYEKARQLAYLREQEEAYKRHIREKELAEIEGRRRAAEAQWSHPSLSVTPPMPTGSMTMPAPHAAAYAMPAPQPSPYAAPPPPSLPPPQPAVHTYYNPYPAPAPAMPPQHYAMASPYSAYPGAAPSFPPPQQPPMMMQGYPGAMNANPYYPQPAPQGMMPMQPSPYAPAAMYQR